MARLPQGKTFEIWVDQAPVTVLSPGYFRTLSEFGVDTISVMVETSKEAWDPKWSRSQLDSLLKLCTANKIKAVITVWPYPDRAWMGPAFKWLDETLLAFPGKVYAIEGDLEMNWKAGHVTGFSGLDIRSGSKQTHRTSLDIAGDEYVSRLEELCTQHKVLAEATTFTEHAENGRNADVASHMDRLKVQAYSIETRPGGRKIPWKHLYGPGKMQHFTLDRTEMVPGVEAGRIQVVAGLPAWSQRWPGHSVDEAMGLALDAALTHQVCGVAYWSSKWFMDSTDDKDVRQFLLSLKH